MKIFFGFTPSNMEIDDSINNWEKQTGKFYFYKEDANKNNKNEK